MNELAVRRGHCIAFCGMTRGGENWQSNSPSSRPGPARPPNPDKKQTAHLAAYSDKAKARRQHPANRGLLEPGPEPDTPDTETTGRGQRRAHKLPDTWLSFFLYVFPSYSLWLVGGYFGSSVRNL